MNSDMSLIYTPEGLHDMRVSTSVVIVVSVLYGTAVGRCVVGTDRNLSNDVVSDLKERSCLCNLEKQVKDLHQHPDIFQYKGR